MRCPSCYRRLTVELVVHQAAECPVPTDRPERPVRAWVARPGASAPRGRGQSACGTRSGYNAGCRCQPCRDAANEYIKARRATAQGKADYARYRANMKARAR